MNKTCRTCRVEKPTQYFYTVKTNVDELSTQCKECRNKVTNAYKRKIIRKKLYDISNVEYNEMIHKQKNVCAICKNKCKKSLSVDHCHNSGKIRGLLCFSCNLGLGNFKDSPKLLAEAIKYLK